jgi:SHS2 domain-containing protein
MAAGNDFMPHPPFEILEHTADAGIVAHGSSMEDVFANAAAGMFALMVELTDVRQAEERRIDVEGRDREALMVRWLTELLYYLDAEEMLFSRFVVDEVSEMRLRARVFGERIDAKRHRLHFGVKAVTRHMLEIGSEGDAYRAQVLFDI